MVRYEDSYEYVIVGSGAGGGPLACNLARAGHTVLLLEAGGDMGESPYYKVPAFHGASTEHPDMQWNYFVRHYASDDQQRRDSKFLKERNGVWYPRAGTLGGCTAHNAMITVYPHDTDWDQIAELTGDPSWNSISMRRYFERLERCEYVPRHPQNSAGRLLVGWLLRALGMSRGWTHPNPGRRGFDGWLTTNVADIRLGLRDRLLLRVIKAASEEAFEHRLETVRGLKRLLIESLQSYVEGSGIVDRLQRHLDPNDYRNAADSPEGLVVTPLATHGGRRRGTRDYLRETERRYPDKLHIRMHALATRVLLDESNTATGVEFLEGPHLYEADPRSDRSASAQAPRASVRATREVILCAGAFNSPQLLKLSGIGPREELEKHGIPVRQHLPGVGENLQDRYEVGVISQTMQNFTLFEAAKFQPPATGERPEPAFRDWLDGKGIYTTNGAVLGIIKRSNPTMKEPDLFIFGIPSNFRGYFPSYSSALTARNNVFTWAILKAQTKNKAGTVTLRSSDPRDAPEINFHYFEEGSDEAGEDLEAVVAGVKFVRGITERAGMLAASEILPGKDITTDDHIRQFVKDEAWGHHAACSNKMGPRTDPMSVVDSDFRVHHTQRLRVVDASVFPEIPGYFIALPIYMISEKASDAILLASEPVPEAASG